ncbi:hypothetical protein IW262DRAFT_1465408 [Armillaria fumosa]|nr:hypothetical protein IW262DRAFT_1465408 [Armillaria fumosa]
MFALINVLSDEDEDRPVLDAAPGSQVTSDLAMLLGDDVHGSSLEPDENAPVLRLPETGGATTRGGPDLSEPDDLALHVMQPALMEDHLITLGVYASLLLLGMYCAVVPTGFAPDTFDPPCFFSFTDAAKLFCLDRSLVEAFKFDQYSSFVNLAYVTPSALSLKGKTVHVGGSNAVCMTVGIITECMLFQPAHQGGYVSASGTQGGKHVKRLCIMPFHQMFWHESTAWVLIFDLEFAETTCISNRGVSFPTRVEDPSRCGNKNSKYMSTHSSPAKGTWKSLTKNLSATSVSPGSGYPASMGFIDEVPIYNGRASAGNHFLFCPSHFAMLKSLPHFITSRDLDAFTLVSVGYSLSVWTAFNNKPHISPNILFAIVLGTVPKMDKLAALGLLE